MKKLFVGNLPYGANETDVQNFFADAGVNVDSVTVMRDRFTGQARGFGFVEINDDAAAQRAVDSCHGKDLMGRTLVVLRSGPLFSRKTNRLPTEGEQEKGWLRMGIAVAPSWKWLGTASPHLPHHNQDFFHQWGCCFQRTSMH